jgi:hypothetical protein
MPLELFNNTAFTTVAAGKTAVAQGTVQSWVVGSSSAFPAASSTANPATQFHIADPASSSELIAVTNVSGTTWTVTRGAEGTTPVTHSAGFTVYQVVSAAGLVQLRDRIDWYNVVTMYGADPSNTTDSTTAIQNAINDAMANVGATVYFPRGTYKISSALSVNTGPASITLQGAGPQASIIKQTSTTASGITVSSSSGEVDNPQIFGLQILGPGSGSGTGVAVSAAAGASPVESLAMRDVLIKSFGSWGMTTETIITSILDNVTCQSNGGGGFFLSAGSAGDGSSTTLTGCYALLNTGRGYYISGQVYSALIGCAADSNYLGYEILNGTTIVLTGCGCESTIAPGGANTLDGTSFKINGPNSFSLTACRSLVNPAAAFWCTGGAYSGVLMACEEVSPAGTATASFKTDSGTTQTFIQCTGTTARSSSGRDIWFGYNGDNNYDNTTAGAGLQIKEGSNCKQGITSAMTGGAITVANTSVTANSRIFLTAQNTGGTPGALRVSARTPGTSFTITSSSGTDTSTVAYQIFEPG